MLSHTSFRWGLPGHLAKTCNSRTCLLSAQCLPTHYQLECALRLDFGGILPIRSSLVVGSQRTLFIISTNNLILTHPEETEAQVCRQEAVRPRCAPGPRISLPYSTKRGPASQSGHYYRLGLRLACLHQPPVALCEVLASQAAPGLT